jgi:hypothetical protein
MLVNGAWLALLLRGLYFNIQIKDSAAKKRKENINTLF